MSEKELILLNLIESRVARRQKRQKIQDIALAAIYLTTMLGATVAAPNTVRLLPYLEKYIGPGPRINRRLSQALVRLREKGLITAGNTLTAEGKTRAASMLSLEKVAPKVPLRWDRKWRIIMFDIWERRREVRDRMRDAIRQLGLIKLQQSVWVYPYPCEELFVYLRKELRLGIGIRYMVVDEIDNDDALRRAFDLPKR